MPSAVRSSIQRLNRESTERYSSGRDGRQISDVRFNGSTERALKVKANEARAMMDFVRFNGSTERALKAQKIWTVAERNRCSIQRLNRESTESPALISAASRARVRFNGSTERALKAEPVSTRRQPRVRFNGSTERALKAPTPLRSLPSFRSSIQRLNRESTERGCGRCSGWRRLRSIQRLNRESTERDFLPVISSSLTRFDSTAQQREH